VGIHDLDGKYAGGQFQASGSDGYGTATDLLLIRCAANQVAANSISKGNHFDVFAI
jgi:hypothetical protein